MMVKYHHIIIDVTNVRRKQTNTIINGYLGQLTGTGNHTASIFAISVETASVRRIHIAGWLLKARLDEIALLHTFGLKAKINYSYSPKVCNFWTGIQENSYLCLRKCYCYGAKYR